MTENGAADDQEDDSGVSWLMIGVIILIFLAFTIIPAVIFFSDRLMPSAR